MVESVLLIMCLLGAAICIANVVGQYVMGNMSTTEGVTMRYFHRLAAKGEVPFFDKLWQENMYWTIRGTERVFNYTGELFQLFGASMREAVSDLKSWLLSHWRKLTIFSIGIAVLTSYGGSNDSEGLFMLGAAGLMGSPDSKDPSKKKEHTMNKLSSKVHNVWKKAKSGEKSIVSLLNAIFNTAWVPFNSKNVEEVPVYTLEFTPSGAKVKPVTVNLPGGGSEELKIEKTCVKSGSGLKFKTLKYFHVEIPRDRIRGKHAIYSLMKYLATNDLVPFGSLKKDSKNRTKFYVLERWEAERYSRHTGDFLPYFHKLFTDCNSVEKLNVLVVDPAKDGKHNDLYHLGVDDKNDGCGLIHPSRSSAQFQAIPDGFGHDPDLVNKGSEPEHDKMPIAKGFLDSNLIETEAEWNTAIGEEYDMVIFRGDQIKCFGDLAESGKWVVGFTWMDGRTIPYPFHWECTQFLKLVPEVEKVLVGTTKDAMDKLFDQVSTRLGLIEYISEKIWNHVQSGIDVTVKMKVLAMLMADVTHEFKWVKRQVDSMILGDIWKITKSYGVFGHGIPLLTNDVQAETDPAYVPFEIANAVGGDNDGDYIVYLVNKAIGKMLYWRFPVVGGPVLRNIPDSLMPALKDHHPEIVKLFVEHMLHVPAFSRNDIIKKRNDRPLDKAFYTARDIIEGEDIGVNTNILKRLLSVLGEHDEKKHTHVNKDNLIENIHRAMICIESGAIALKYDVEGIEKPNVESWISKLYPMEFAKLTRPTSWTKLAEMVEKLGASSMMEFDTRCYHAGLKYAHELFIIWDSNVVSTKRMAESIDVWDIDMTLVNTTKAMGFLKEIGSAFRGVFELYGDPVEGSDDAKELQAALSLVVKAAERRGAELSLDVLKLAVHEYLLHTKGTGASAVHMCGDRIFDVFGKHESTPDNVTIELPKPSKDGLIIRAYAKGRDIPFDKIRPASGRISGNTIKFNGTPALTIYDDCVGKIPTGTLTVASVTSYVTKDGKSSNRTANILVQVVK
jgi:hypothetical protein